MWLSRVETVSCTFVHHFDAEIYGRSYSQRKISFRNVCVVVGWAAASFSFFSDAPGCWAVSNLSLASGNTVSHLNPGSKLRIPPLRFCEGLTVKHMLPRKCPCKEPSRHYPVFRIRWYRRNYTRMMQEHDTHAFRSSSRCYASHKQFSSRSNTIPSRRPEIEERNFGERLMQVPLLHGGI